jgi:CheY-like chemotaxis protein
MTRVLVADDDPEARATLAEMLEVLDCTVQTARDGAEALESIRQGLPDAILLDLAMPRMDAEGFLVALRGTPEGARVPVILVSGSPERAADLARRYRAHVVPKPPDVVELLAAFQDVVPA